ncbi:MAG TPA: AMP-dependent synthetase/ligase [Polyangiaceae bacterium LLY-WYZ-15_(1-7)]|nr:AMP-dependent synthetase/ligase [Polyangiaceae bacterium LLY-WYZ-15_(1-7)]HJL01525.1 AMP-dependent synthetase/ligase [Polyangiaceae bacterium LLY-WYZ-15_(1-7)]HJL13031.1 AMP-dependent synthetase/ligase [Polyangiaceae bacterium LLY-WYZ-15_(1-7)]HJL23400.1 AMP-dependent synthetase/ligase [Polyangiaceae bacterium LLY-WYZ-15_(1-7)]HJL28777.1 AMP-dependent synthetase/ligase [Polyangiaceae bacterium LLY-WYZ-15_(1-7)]
MDVSRYLELRVAPKVVFDHLPERRSRPRFMVQRGGDWEAVTWQAFADQIRDVALYLATEMKSGDRACIFAPNRVEWLSAALGIQAMGGAMVPIYGSSTPEQAGYVVEHSDAKVVFVDTAPLLERVLRAWSFFDAVERVVLLSDDLDPQAIAERLRGEGATAPGAREIEKRFVTWSRARALGAARHREEPEAFARALEAVSLDQPGLMLYTSGTSGQPKGVPLTHRNVGVNGRDWLEVNAPLLEEGMVDLLWLPMSHIFGFGEAGAGNQLGWVSYLTDPKQVMEKLPEVRPTVFMSVPSVWDKIARAAAAAGDDAKAQKETLDALTGGQLRFCLSGGAGLKREVKELFHRHGTLIIEGYGLTECSPTLTLNRAGAFRFDSVGKPLPSVELRLAEDGEILARGDNVFGGYHKDPAATQACFAEDGWLKTGDIGRWTDDGFLQIVDRKKDILVTAGGKNVAPANIEVRFNDDPFLAHVVVYGDGEKYLVAGVWVDGASVKAHLEKQGADAADEAAVRALVQKRIDRVNAELARYETIKKFALIDEPLTVEGGMLTPTMKVKRKKVYERWGETLAALY